VDPVPDPLLLRKSGSAGNWTRTAGLAARNWRLDHRGSLLAIKRVFNYAEKWSKYCYRITLETSTENNVMWKILGFQGGMWHRVAFVKNDISEENIASIIRVGRIRELGTLAATSNWVPTLKKESIRSSKMLVLITVTRRYIPVDGILHVMWKIWVSYGGMWCHVAPVKTTFRKNVLPRSAGWEESAS
jgi:hypothetical protein